MALLNYIHHHSIIYCMSDDTNNLSLLTHEQIIPCAVANEKQAAKDFLVTFYQ